METDEDDMVIPSTIPEADAEDIVPIRGRFKKKSFFKRQEMKKFKTFISNKLFTFYNVHLLYLFSIAVLGSIIIFIIESNNPVYERKGIDTPRYIDVLFNSISAVCCCGLNTSDISIWRTSSLVVVLCVTELGCLGFSTCIIVPLFRCKRAKKLEKIRRENYFDNTDDYLRQRKDYSDEDDYGYRSLTTTNSMMNSINVDTHDLSSLNSTLIPTKSSSGRDPLFDDKDENSSSSSSSSSNTNNSDINNNLNDNGINDNDSDSDDPIHSVADLDKKLKSSSSRHKSTCTNLTNFANSDSTHTLTPLLGDVRDEWDSDGDKSHFTETLRYSTNFKRMSQTDEVKNSRRKSRKVRAGEPKNMGLDYNYGMEKEGDKWLVIITICYTLITQIVGYCLLLFFSKVEVNMDEAIKDHGSSRAFWTFFMTITSFTNLGYNFWGDGLNNHNLSKSPGLVLTMSILIVSGNVCIPIFVRFWVWMCRNLSPQRNKPKYLQSLREILKQPHRYSMHLFSSAFTRVLICVYVVLWFSIIFSYLQSVNGWGSIGYWLEAILISISSRAGGFNIVDMRGIKTAVLLFILGSMFVSAYPIDMIRKQDKAIMKEKLRKPRSKMTVLTKYWKGVALNNILWIYVGLIILCYNEYGQNRPNREYMDPFSLLFELVSAYGTIGYSLGYKICTNSTNTTLNVPAGYYNSTSMFLQQNNTFSTQGISAAASAAAAATSTGFSAPVIDCSDAPVSLAGGMRSVSKIVIMMAMLAGRHRGLPSHLYHKDMREGVKQQTKLVDLGV